MKTLRRLAALVAIAALTVPLLGAAGGARAVTIHDDAAFTTDPGQADVSSQGRGHCNDHRERSNPPSPCHGGDAATCPPLSSCTLSHAMVLERTSDDTMVARTIVSCDVASEPAGTLTSPEPPPPRA